MANPILWHLNYSPTVYWYYYWVHMECEWNMRLWYLFWQNLNPTLQVDSRNKLTKQLQPYKRWLYINNRTIASDSRIHVRNVNLTSEITKRNYLLMSYSKQASLDQELWQNTIQDMDFKFNSVLKIWSCSLHNPTFNIKSFIHSRYFYSTS